MCFLTKNKRPFLFAVSALLVAGALGGCGKEEKTGDLITVVSGDDEISYNFTTVVRDDVYETQTVRCSYQKNAEQEVFFPVSGKKIDRVLVNVGDEVKKGDVLAQLDVGSLQGEIETLKYKISRNELLLSYIEEQEILDTQSIVLDYYYGYLYGNEEAKDNKIEELKKQNEKAATGYNDSLEFDRRELQKLQGEYQNSMVRAAFDGTVNFVAENLQGSTTNVETCIIKIQDNEEGYFEAQAGELASYFTDGEIVEMKIAYGDGKGDYELLPLNMDEWGESQYFSIVSGLNMDELSKDSKGDITIITNKRENVLCIPASCVRLAGEDSYVYVLDENGMRSVRWIETGVKGDGKIEVTKGLDEGDKVIVR